MNSNTPASRGANPPRAPRPARRTRSGGARAASPFLFLFFWLVLLAGGGFPRPVHAVTYQADVQRRRDGGVHVTLTALLDAPAAAVRQVFLHFNEWDEFNADILEATRLSPAGAQELVGKGLRNEPTIRRLIAPHQLSDAAGRNPTGVWTVYVYNRFLYPFPLQNRWHLAEYTIDETPRPDDSFKACWKRLAGLHQRYEGCQKIIPEGANRTRLEYAMDFDPGGIVPDWLVALGMNITLPQFLNSLERQARKFAVRH